MRYTVNTDKARKIYKTAQISEKVMLACAYVFPLGAVVAMLCRKFLIGYIMCGITVAGGLAFIAALLTYFFAIGHVATRYIELMDHTKHNILGCHVRNPQGSNGYEGMQEVYFTYEDEAGEVKEWVMGIVRETTEHYLEAPMVDITRQVFYI